MAVRLLRGPLDLTIIILYFPPQPKYAKETQLPAGGKGAHSLGISRAAGTWREVEADAVGDGRSREHRRLGAGERLRQVHEQHFLLAMNTRSADLQPTFFGGSGGQSTIDFICAPLGMTDFVQVCHPVYRLGASFKHTVDVLLETMCHCTWR
eukprot:1552855-Pyramimonas_sp.AAC.1